MGALATRDVGAARFGRDVPLQVSLFAHPLRGLRGSLPGNSADVRRLRGVAASVDGDGAFGRPSGRAVGGARFMRQERKMPAKAPVSQSAGRRRPLPIDSVDADATPRPVG